MNPDCKPSIQIVLLPCLVATLLFAQINIPSHISLWGVNIFGLRLSGNKLFRARDVYMVGTDINPLQSVQFPVNFLRQRTADAIRLLQFFNTCGLHAFQAAEPCQQALTTLGADTINFL